MVKGLTDNFKKLLSEDAVQLAEENPEEVREIAGAAMLYMNESIVATVRREFEVFEEVSDGFDMRKVKKLAQKKSKEWVNE